MIFRGIKEAGGELSAAEIAIFKKLLERRDLWTDEQVLALGREVGSKAGVGNLGTGKFVWSPGVPIAKQSSRSLMNLNMENGLKIWHSISSSRFRVSTLVRLIRSKMGRIELMVWRSSIDCHSQNLSSISPSDRE